MPDFQQSVELMKNMWANTSKSSAEGSPASFGIPNMSALNPFGIPILDAEELDKRIKDLKSVESWLSLNLNVLQSTIQGLEVQRATLAALQGIAQTMKTASKSEDKTPTDVKDTVAQAAQVADAGGKLAQELMEQMSKSVANMMTVFPPSSPATKKTQRKRSTNPSAKTAKRPQNP